MQLCLCQLKKLKGEIEDLLHRIYFRKSGVFEQAKSRDAKVRVEYVYHVPRSVRKAS